MEGRAAEGDADEIIIHHKGHKYGIGQTMGDTEHPAQGIGHGMDQANTCSGQRLATKERA